jgi:sigma54-dependent transcription regulator
MRVGSERHLHTVARIIAASHIQLNEAAKQGKFREDLLYRLDVVKLHIPPLRERKEDIPYLAKFLLKRHAGEQLSYSSDAIDLMEQYDWPGNVRKLSYVITRAITFADGETTIITPDYLSINLERSNLSFFTVYPARMCRKRGGERCSFVCDILIFSFWKSFHSFYGLVIKNGGSGRCERFKLLCRSFALLSRVVSGCKLN